MGKKEGATVTYTREFTKYFDDFADEIGNLGDGTPLQEIFQKAWDIAFEAGKKEGPGQRSIYFE